MNELGEQFIQTVALQTRDLKNSKAWAEICVRLRERGVKPRSVAALGRVIWEARAKLPSRRGGRHVDFVDQP